MGTLLKPKYSISVPLLILRQLADGAVSIVQAKPLTPEAADAAAAFWCFSAAGKAQRLKLGRDLLIKAIPKENPGADEFPAVLCSF